MSSSFGFSFLLNKSLAGSSDRFLQSVSVEEAVRQSILLILSTQKGERALYPNYGAQLRRFMFRKVDAELMHAIAEDVSSALSTSEPRIKIEEVRVEQDERSQSRLWIVIEYLVKQTMSKQSVVYPMEAFD